MFTWEKSLQKLDVPAAQVLHLFRSMRDVQLALPGQSVQQASAYLCQYRRESGVATVAVFHMQKSQSLAFYCSNPVIVADDKAESLLYKGLNFVESMGFLLSDMDLNLLEDEDRAMLWDSLPLAAGLELSQPEEDTPARSESKVPAAKVAETTPKESKTAAKAPMTTESADAESSPKPQFPPASASPADKVEDLVDVEPADDTVDDLLAAVEALRAKRPALRVRRKTPNPVEIQKRRQKLREDLGRILSSL